MRSNAMRKKPLMRRLEQALLLALRRLCARPRGLSAIGNGGWFSVADIAKEAGEKIENASPVMSGLMNRPFGIEQRTRTQIGGGYEYKI